MSDSSICNTCRHQRTYVELSYSAFAGRDFKVCRKFVKSNDGLHIEYLPSDEAFAMFCGGGVYKPTLLAKVAALLSWRNHEVRDGINRAALPERWP